MQAIKLLFQNRSGLLPEHDGIAPVVYEVRATIPVVEDLHAAGAIVEPLPPPMIGYRIVLSDTMPDNIVAVHVNSYGAIPQLGLRLRNEPEYPQEFQSYWDQLDFTPCPICKAPVVWYEAAFVSGYRICSKPPYHHLLAK